MSRAFSGETTEKVCRYKKSRSYISIKKKLREFAFRWLFYWFSQPILLIVYWFVRAIFVWSWNENARTKQRQQRNGNRAIWLVYRTDTNARGFWVVKRTLNRCFTLTSYLNTIGQSNNALSILGFSLAGKQRVHVLNLFIHWLIKQMTNTHRNQFSRSHENRSNWCLSLLGLKGGLNSQTSRL